MEFREGDMSMNDLLLKRDIVALQRYDISNLQKQMYNNLYQELKTKIYHINKYIEFNDLVLNILTNLLQQQAEQDLISVYDIVDIIDELNIDIILQFCKSKGINNDEIFDDLIALYTHYVSCNLDDWVKIVLTNNGYPFLEMYNEYIDNTIKLQLPIVINREQNLLFPELYFKINEQYIIERRI